MGIDRDFPMTRTQIRLLLVGLLVMSVVAAALFGGFIPGFRPNFNPPSTVQVDGVTYFDATLTLNPPIFPQNSSPPQELDFHGVVFALWFTHWNWVSQAWVEGNGTEANGTVDSFLLGETTTPPMNTSLYLAPDESFGAFWPGLPAAGGLVRVLVRA